MNKLIETSEISLYQRDAVSKFGQSLGRSDQSDGIAVNPEKSTLRSASSENFQAVSSEADSGIHVDAARSNPKTFHNFFQKDWNMIECLTQRSNRPAKKMGPGKCSPVARCWNHPGKSHPKTPSQRTYADWRQFAMRKPLSIPKNFFQLLLVS